MNGFKLFAFIFLAVVSTQVDANTGVDALTVTTNENGGQTYSLTLQVLAIMTLLTLLPAGLIMMTSFTRIIIVLALLRQAMGTASTPTNQVLIGLALFLTMFIMAPVFKTIYSDAVEPYINEEIPMNEALNKASTPIRDFMLGQIRESDLKLFMELDDTGEVGDLDDIPFTVIVPAFITSELKTAFQIGFLIFIPFLVIDFVVASVLMSMGMMMLSPLIISLPFKLMLFVLVDGWALVLGTLANSFAV